MAKSNRPSGLSLPRPVGTRLNPKVRSAAERAAKRSFDVVLALVLLAFLIPLLVALSAVISASDGGPALFRQRRVGRQGKPFTCLKFRTMRCDAEKALNDLLEADSEAAREWTENQKLSCDPRITPLGQFLRRTSLDELPQLLNILSGEMSFVGPRPIVEAEIARYGEAFSQCFSVPPGLTGLWQVSGRSDCGYVTRVALDARYARDWTLALDLQILVQTVPAVLSGRGSR